MKLKRVCEILNLSHTTVINYRLAGKLKYRTLPSGRIEYDDDSVFELAGKKPEKLICVYSRVSSLKQKADLRNQTAAVVSFVNSKGLSVDKTFEDTASGISFSKRKEFFKLLDLILDRKVEKVFISYKDRMSRVGFELFDHLFKRFGCEIVIMNASSDPNQELITDIVSTLHSYSMSLYGKRKYIKQLVESCK